jgi:plastocyanin
VGNRILKLLVVVGIAIALTTVAHAGGRVSGKVSVTDAGGTVATRPGKISSDVIVYLVGFTEPAPTGKPPPQIQQKNRKFVPDLVAITVGESVSFPNGDVFLHNVFSQSNARKFDLGSFKKGETKDKSFPNPGVIDVYCNIHPEMAATILVLPNTKHTRVANDGSFTIADVPPGTWTVFAYARRAAKPASIRVDVVDGKDVSIDLRVVRGTEPMHANKFGEKYTKDYSRR